MELKTIKLSGFKSFADPMVLPVKTRLTAIVGPNGCGKSNIIDAVRCVLSGAARHLRGDTLSDVVFNGSASRKPMGRASVELIFDNHDGALGGEYAQYPEISVRRQIDRAGTSDYFLNGTHCRRKDIIDLFLGTGLGPQSYAIIEQGMIARIIEAKPEELRAYLEEAAGISRYRERRRETENRLQHTQENLDRLNDHRLELEKQLNHLQKQAETAEKYKTLKQEERTLQAEYQALHYQALTEQLQTQHQQMAQQQNEYEAKMAELRKTDAAIEQVRQQETQTAEAVNGVQERYYSASAEISRLEQTVHTIKERRQQLTVDLAQLMQNDEELRQTHEQDQLQLEELQNDVVLLEPQLTEYRAEIAQAETDLQEAEQAMHAWQGRWDSFNQTTSKTMQTAQVQQTHLQHLRQTIERTKERVGRMQQEQQQWNFPSLEQELEQLATELGHRQMELTEQQTRLDEVNACWQTEHQQQEQLLHVLDQSRRTLQQTTGRQASLEALQQEALGKKNTVINQWLQQQSLAQQPRLAEQFQVQAGWETAIETVLGSYLEAVCVENFDHLIPAVAQFTQGQLTLIQTTASCATPLTGGSTLADKVTSHIPLTPLLSSVYGVETTAEALALLPQLAPHQSVITREGLWFGPTWMRINKKKDSRAGIIERERELKELAQSIATQQLQITAQEQQLQQTKARLLEYQQSREQLQQQKIQLATQLGKSTAERQGKQNQLQQLQQRAHSLNQELLTHQQQLADAENQFAAATAHLQQAQTTLQAAESERQQLQQERDHCRQTLEEARRSLQHSKTAADEAQLRLETSRSQLHMLRQSLTRAEKQLQDLQQRRNGLQQAQEESTPVLATAEQQLQTALTERLEIEHALQARRQELNQLQHVLQQQEQTRQNIDQHVQQLRNGLEEARLQTQALQLRQAQHVEKIIALGLVLETVMQQLAADATIAVWEERLQKMENRIQRLGAINLAAIEECQVLAERKNYLDAQHHDLVEAMTTLAEAIRKIDQESRTRLKETYDQVNSAFSELFQQVFQGGQATLEMTEQDFLTAGMVVKAQPPGKRNTTIHLLSGGEKALTAIALVFALFQLNPAPFCILDEVDAPLDDLNVGRFCALVKQMSQKVQFLFISHNKLTIEIADQLIGVTMHEPGVSRLVAVDVEQAIAMATA